VTWSPALIGHRLDYTNLGTWEPVVSGVKGSSGDYRSWTSATLSTPRSASLQLLVGGGSNSPELSLCATTLTKSPWRLRSLSLFNRYDRLFYQQSSAQSSTLTSYNVRSLSTSELLCHAPPERKHVNMPLIASIECSTSSGNVGWSCDTCRRDEHPVASDKRRAEHIG
jgi:hypothetical protein